MIRKVFKKRNSSNKLDTIITKYNVPREYLSVNRNAVSKAVLVGLFFAFIPMPLQMLAVILMVPFIKFNVPIGVGLVWITNPVTMPFIFYGELIIGDLLTLNPITQDLDFIVELFTMDWFTTDFLSKLMEIIVPMYIGALFTATIIAIGGYYLVRYLWWRSVHHQKLKKEKRFHINP
ncbi:MAG: DUF2062 domain-containing protein [Helicobacteraceae bacterium]|jgi:uncharacterized protein (DUF2062 family)|nr:DUF2062 domain-containing protein [Helicobacteraceae bacterium]